MWHYGTLFTYGGYLMKYIICYDIANHKRLSHIAKILNHSGYRVQKSFFSCDITENEFKSILSEMLKAINLKEDKIAIYRICDKCVSNGAYIGCTVKDFFDKDYLVL